jgi:transcriptional regulator with XRE-family HTH domain
MDSETDRRPNPVDTHVGRRIRLRRTLLRMSREDLGDAVGLSSQSIQKYENGAIRIGASRLYDLSRAMHVPVAFFFDDMSNPLASRSPATSGNDTLTSRETLELVGAYYRITEPSVREHVFRLIASMGPPEA